LERNYRVVRNSYVFRANLGATLRNVAVTNPLRFGEFLDPALRIERMHLQRRHINEEARPDKVVMLVMLAQHVTYVLAQKAFDAFSKFLHAVHIFLLHAPASIRRVGRARLEFLDLFLDPEISRN